jgi:hypothetical protein
MYLVRLIIAAWLVTSFAGDEEGSCVSPETLYVHSVLTWLHGTFNSVSVNASNIFCNVVFCTVRD